MNKIELLNAKVFYNNFGHTFYVNLWRMSEGNRERAYHIIRETLKHYTTSEYTDFELDCFLAELDGGCEIEWNS